MTESSAAPRFQQPTAVERLFNRLFGFLVGRGLGPRDKYLLQVRGRKSGKLFSTPINLLERDGKRFLIAPRGQTQWVRNAEAAGGISLKRGGYQENFRVVSVGDRSKSELLKAYLEQFKSEVQRYFPIAAGSDVSAFDGIAADYPVFELVAKP